VRCLLARKPTGLQVCLQIGRPLGNSSEPSSPPLPSPLPLPLLPSIVSHRVVVVVVCALILCQQGVESRQLCLTKHIALTARVNVLPEQHTHTTAQHSTEQPAGSSTVQQEWWCEPTVVPSCTAASSFNCLVTTQVTAAMLQLNYHVHDTSFLQPVDTLCFHGQVLCVCSHRRVNCPADDSCQFQAWTATAPCQPLGSICWRCVCVLCCVLCHPAPAAYVTHPSSMARLTHLSLCRTSAPTLLVDAISSSTTSPLLTAAPLLLELPG